MSGYGSPPTTPMPAAPRRSMNLDLPQLIGYAAGVLGILAFIWGFLDWFTGGGSGIAGYSVAVFGSGGVVIGLSIIAGAIAAAGSFEKKPIGTIPAALALVAFLLTLGLLVGRSPSGQHIGVGIGLILMLITTILQTAGLVYVWLLATGRVRMPQRRPAAGGWPAQHQPQRQDQYPAGPGMSGPGAPPPGQFAPQPPPGGYASPAQPQYGPPPSHGQQYPGPPPEASRGYGPPPGTGSPGAPPSATPAEPGPSPSAPSSPPEDHPGGQWSPQTSYPGSRAEPERPEPEEGSANP